MGHSESSSKGGFLLGLILFIALFITLVSYVYGLNADSLPIQ